MRKEKRVHYMMMFSVGISTSTFQRRKLKIEETGRSCEAEEERQTVLNYILRSKQEKENGKGKNEENFVIKRNY